MKKALAFILIAVMAVSAIFVAAHADGETKTVTFTFADMGIEDKAALTELVKDGVKITFGSGSNTSNSPMYYDNGKAARIYKNNEFTVSSDSAILSVAFTFTAASYALEYGVNSGSFAVSDAAGTWTGSANSVKFTNPDSGQTRIVEMKVTLDSTGSQPGEPEQPETPTYTTPEEIVNALYALEKNATLPGGPYSLTGVVTEINYSWNESKQNMTVTIVVGEMTDKPIQCYYLTNSEACAECASIAEGDTITVKGVLKHFYNSNKDTSTFEFDRGCTLEARTPKATEPEQPVLDTPEKIVKAAYDLEVGKALDGTYELTGTIISVDTPYNSQFGNVTVTIVVEGLEDYPIQCFRLKNGAGVDGVDKIAEKDIITVSGKLKRYTETVVEFDKDCELLAFTIVEKEEEQLPETVEEILNALYALEDGKFLKGEYTLTGKVTEITTAYSEEYQNITVVMTVEGFEDKPVTCYRLAGEGADKIAIGDTITVTGPMKNHRGTYEFAQPCTLDAIEYGPNHKPDNTDTSDAAVAVAAITAIAALGCAIVIGKKR